MPIHDKLKKLRHDKNLSQIAIADKLYMSQNAYSLIENGKTKIDESRMLQLAKILGVHPYELLDNDMAFLNFSYKEKPAEANNANVINVKNIELISMLSAQINKKDEQINKLLTNLERLSQLYIKETSQS